MRETVKNKNADYLEIRVEESHSTRLVFRGPALDDLSQSIDYGGNIRALVNGGWGFVSFNKLEDLEAKVQQAITQAQIIGETRKERSTLAPAPVVRDEVRLELKKDPCHYALEEKKAIFEDYNKAILAYGGPITTSSVVYIDKFSTIHFANSEGTYILQEKLDLSGSISAVATREGLTQTGRTSFGSSDDFGVALGLESKVEDACQEAVDLLNAPVVKGGEYTVIVDPKLAGIFAHEAFGHLSEGDNVYENKQLQKVMTLGTRFGGDHLTIYDSGLDKGARGYLKYDDEGVATERTDLIRDGILVGRLHSRETAGKMGEEVTGSARALNYRFPPICRMRNTCIAPGEATFEDMIKDIKLGLYVLDSYGGQTNGEMFTFSAGKAYMIRDGGLAELVRDVNLTGNVFTTLKNIDMIGKDFTAFEAAGGCGKGQQGPLPTSEWAPHLRIQKVVIGGEG